MPYYMQVVYYPWSKAWSPFSGSTVVYRNMGPPQSFDLDDCLSGDGRRACREGWAGGWIKLSGEFTLESIPIDNRDKHAKEFAVISPIE